MKHIMILTPGFPASEADSRCIPPLQALLREYQRQEAVRLTVISLHFPYISGSYVWEGISVHCCHSDAPYPVSKLLKWRKAWRYFSHVFDSEKIDGIHSFWLHDCALLGQHLARKYQLPHWVTLMGQDVLSTNRYRYLIRMKQLNTIAVSTFQAEKFRQTTGLAPNHIIPWGLDATSTQSELPVNKTIDILGVGSLTELKNYSAFISVVDTVAQSNLQLKALIIGDGPEYEKLNRQIKEKKLESQIVLTGGMSREAVLAQMRQSKILLHTSNYESFGYVFVEALHAGMGIVSRPVGIESDSDQWRRGNSEAELAKCVKDLLANSDSFRSLLPFTIAETAEKYLRLYRQA